MQCAPPEASLPLPWAPLPLPPGLPAASVAASAGGATAPPSAEGAAAWSRCACCGCPSACSLSLASLACSLRSCRQQDGKRLSAAQGTNSAYHDHSAT
jgi:hypothetical protein